jgi:hypothetical protein
MAGPVNDEQTHLPHEEPPDQEPAKGQAEPAASKARRSFSKIKRELTDDELSSPAVQKLLIDELERLERDCVELSDYRDRFYRSDREVGILTERLRRSLASEIISITCFVVGAAALGYAPSLWSANPAGVIALIFGGALIVAGIAAKVVSR